MAFCSKCGNQLGEEAKFCAVCGASIETPEPIENKETQSEENSVQTQNVVHNVHTDFNAPVQVNTMKKSNPLKIIIPAVSGVLVIAIILGIVLLNLNKSIVIENEDGEDVFAITLSDFVDRVNKHTDFMISVGEFEKYDEGDEIEYYYTNDDMSLYINVDANSYPAYITDISVFSYKTTDEVIWVYQALFPNLTEYEVYSILSDCVANDDVFISRDEYDDCTYWHMYPWII